MLAINAITLALLQLSAADQDSARSAITEALASSGSTLQPNVRFVGKDHWAFKNQKRLAMAARDDDGQSWILINKDGPPKELIPRAQHEVGHLLAWDKYGEKIPEHGSQFRQMCRSVVTDRPANFCKGNH